MIRDTDRLDDARAIELTKQTIRCDAAALHGNLLGYVVVVAVPDSDLQVMGPLKSFKLRNPSGDNGKIEEFRVVLNVAGHKLRVPGNHSIYFPEDLGLPAPSLNQDQKNQSR